MKKCVVAMVLLSLLLAGCSVFDGNYVSVSRHQEQLTETHSGSITASNYYQLRQAMAELVEAGTENAVIHIPEYSQDLVKTGMEAASHYVQELLPLGAYAVDSVHYEIGTVAGQPAVSVAVSYIHGRSEIRKVRRVEDMDGAKEEIRTVLGQCGEGVVFLIDNYKNTDIGQMVEDFAVENPNLVMEIPQVAVGLYPESGSSRVLELKFTYQSSRDALRQMQTQVQRVFASAALYVSSDGEPAQKYAQLYNFLMERFDYAQETSITPSYSLLCHGVGDSKAFAAAFGAMCRQAGLECRIVSGTRAGEAWFWNLIQVEDQYYHVDLLACKQTGELQMQTDDQMLGYVWDYSAYPAAENQITGE